jgi:predicted kinase
MREPIVLPQPALVVLIGPAGAGKSTFARDHFEPGEVLSSDALRARIGSGEADQSVSRAAFGALHRALERRLAAGRTTVVDATNLRPAARRALLVRAARAGVAAVAIVLDPPAAVVLARAAGRTDRIVPIAIVERHLAEMAGVRRPGTLEAEGFATVHRLDGVAELRGRIVRPGERGTR